MKKYLSVVGLLMLAAGAQAQESKKPASVNRTVFSDAHSSNAGRGATVMQIQKKVQAAFPKWNARIDAAIGSFTDVYGPAMAIPGADVAARAQYCMSHQLVAFGVNSNDWQISRNTVAPKATFVDFTQSFNGRPVVFSRLSFRFANNGKLVRIQMKNYGTPQAGLSPTVTVAEAEAIAVSDLDGATVVSKTVSPNWVWFPVPVSGSYELHPAYSFTASGTASDGNLPMELTGYVDAINGTLLYRDNEVKETFDATIKGVVYPNTTASPTSLEALPNLLVTVGTTNYYTDANGLLDIPALTAPITATVKLQGKWSKVNTGSNTGPTPSYTKTFGLPNLVDTFISTGSSSIRHVNAYYHVNRIHDFHKQFFPTFTQLDVALPTNVDVNGSCNAFYNGSSINFYSAGSGCNSFAEIGDVVYHEYGHGISGRFYNWQNAGAMRNGALNEGSSDVWAMSLTHNPTIGANAYVGGGYIREYNNTPKVFPKDIKGEVHADGEIVAGAWWDVGLNMGSVDSMTALFAQTYFDLPDGPTGSEGDVFHQVLVSALLNDDNDNNLNNGSPHFVEIVNAFALHGIYLLGDAEINHPELAHQAAGTDITVNAGLVLTSPGIFEDMKLFYRVRGAAWDSVVMTETTPFNFTAQIPGKPAGTIMDYYFRVSDTFAPADRIYFPKGYDPNAASIQSNIPFQFGIGLETKTVTNFESTVTGWGIGSNPGDNASSGKWTQAVPVSSMQTGNGFTPLICQTGADHTTGAGQCLVTGNAGNTTSSINAADVDSGTTTVLTPEIDIASFTYPVIEYYRWYGNDRGSNARSDAWRVNIRAVPDPVWLIVENTNQSDYSWRRRIFGIREYMPAEYNLIQMQFIAVDALKGTLPNYGQSTVEAGLDDFIIYDKAKNLGVGGSAALRSSIFPNPANEQVQITLPADNLSGTIGLYDLSGRRIAQQAIVPGTTNYSIATRSIAAGQYMVFIQTGVAVQSQKVTVAH